MAIEVHLLKSNYDGSGRLQPAGGNILSGSSHGFINIGWYLWSWASSRCSLNNFFLQILHFTCSQRVLTIVKEWSVNPYSDESRWCFRGWFRDSGILVRTRANTCTHTTAALNPAKCGGERYKNVTLHAAFFTNKDIYIISRTSIMHIVCCKSLAENRMYHSSSLQSPQWALYYTTSLLHCELFLPWSLRAADNEGRSS